MRIECPECGAKFNFAQPIPLDKQYRCRKCHAVVTFRQVDDTPVTSPRTTKETAPPAKPVAAKREIPPKTAPPVKQGPARTTPVLKTNKRFSTSFLVIVGILVVVVIVVAVFMFR